MGLSKCGFLEMVFIVLIGLLLPLSASAEVGTIINDKGEKFLNYKNIQKAEQKGKWLPVPIPVSNPTMGSGLTAALLYLHPRKDQNSDAKSATSGIGGMYTDSRSWFVGAFHDGSWIDDRVRLTAFVGTGGFNLKYYGVGEDSWFQEHPVGYKIEPDAVYWQLLGEPFKGSNWYAGLRHVYTTADVTLKTSDLLDPLPDIEGKLTTSSLGTVLIYDSRNNTYYPEEGSVFKAMAAFDAPAWNSDFTFQKYSGSYTHYFHLMENGVVALKGDMAVAEGLVPFYMLPSLDFRGVATGRYSDDAVVSGHVEWRHKFLPRWGYILSYEAGFTNSSLGGIFDGRYVYSLGTGLRWQVLKDYKIHIGLDFGINADDHAICVQVGERF